MQLEQVIYRYTMHLKMLCKDLPAPFNQENYVLLKNKRTLDKLAQQFLQDGKVNKSIRNIPN